MIPLNSAWESPHSQKHPQLFHLNLLGETGSAARGTALFQSTEMLSSVNVNFFFFYKSLVSKLKTSWQ